MRQQNIKSKVFSPVKGAVIALSVAIAATLTTGCDSGPSSSGSSAPANMQAKIEGMVQDIHGPIKEGKIEVHDKSGQLVTSFQLDGSSNRYSITVPAGTSYPILLTATPVPGSNADVVKAVVTSPLADRMDITDVTTLVVDSAIALGGLTEANIAKASGGAIGLRQRQGVSAGAGGGGMGPGQSGGGAGRGGHAGHDMSGMGGGGTAPSATSSPAPQHQMQH